MVGLPFEFVAVHGQDAFATWQGLRAEGRGYPVVLGEEKDVDNLLEMQGFARQDRNDRIAEILEKAQHLRHPDDLLAQARRSMELTHENLKQLFVENPHLVLLEINDSTKRPCVGEWPEQVCGSPGLSVTQKLVFEMREGRRSYSRKTKEQVIIGLFPVSSSFEVLGYLHYGAWNSCPAPEYHVAAQRSWQERYGAEIVGVNHDTLNIVVTRKPQTREEALDLAREHNLYCNDVIDQGVGTLSNLAASLMAHDWWYFWWD